MSENVVQRDATVAVPVLLIISFFFPVTINHPWALCRTSGKSAARVVILRHTWNSDTPYSLDHMQHTRLPCITPGSSAARLVVLQHPWKPPGHPVTDHCF